jgi:hypothetical protein
MNESGPGRLLLCDWIYIHDIKEILCPRINNADNINGEISWEDLDWIHPAEGRDHWLALVNMAINIRFQ